MKRTILHCDLNNFYASVECKDKPEYACVPLAVCGNIEKRHGVVLAKNELAKKFGVKTGDVAWEAQQKCPNLVLVPPHFDKYMYYSKKVFDFYTQYTSKVEPFGADECWLDVTGSAKLYGDGVTIGNAIRQGVKETIGLTLSVGVSFNKIFAKLGSDMKKPDGLTLISEDNFRDLIWKMPAKELFMVGSKTNEKLASLNIHTIGEIASADKASLKSHLGINGVKLWENANGLNSEPVREYVDSRKIASVGHGMTAVKDIASMDMASSLIYYLSDLIATRLRKYALKGYGVSINLRDHTLRSVSKQTKLPHAVYSATEIGDNAVKLCLELFSSGNPLRTITVSVFDLTPISAGSQVTMFDEKAITKANNLDKTIDKLRNKYGYASIIRANLMGTDFIYDKTEAEDFLPFQR